MSNNNIFEFQTIQVSSIKYLFDVLKDILNDTTLIINKEGLQIVSFDAPKTTLVSLRLKADKFETFNYNAKDKDYPIGINIIHLSKIIKTFKNDDILTFFIDINDVHNLCIIAHNSEKHYNTTYKIPLKDLNYMKLDIPEILYNVIIKLKSDEFQDIIRNMNNICADIIDIKYISNGNKIIFSCDGDFCHRETIIIPELIESSNISDDNSQLLIEKYNENKENFNIIQGLFKLKELEKYSKCVHLSNNVNIYFTNDRPLIVEYNVAELGNIKFCLGPQVNID